MHQYFVLPGCELKLYSLCELIFYPTEEKHLCIYLGHQDRGSRRPMQYQLPFSSSSTQDLCYLAFGSRKDYKDNVNWHWKIAQRLKDLTEENLIMPWNSDYYHYYTYDDNVGLIHEYTELPLIVIKKLTAFLTAQQEYKREYAKKILERYGILEGL